MEDRTATPRLSRLASPTIETTAKVPHSSSPSFPSSSTFNNLDHLDHLDHNMSLEDVKQTPPIHFAADHDLQDTQDARDLKRDAKAATEKEQKMTMIQGIRLYPKAVAWSMALSLLIVMEGYQVCLLGNFYAFPQFNKKFGTLQPDGTYQVSAAWQAGLSNGANVGELLGLTLNGYVSERMGYRFTILVALFCLTGFIALPTFGDRIELLQLGEILCGIVWGIFQTISLSYAVEVAPLPLRANLATWLNSCWGIGQVLGVGVIKALLNRTDDLAWRLPFALQWMWPVPLAIIVFFAPESPWWLVRRGRIEDARKSLLRLTSRKANSDFDVDETISMMVHTTQLENKITAGSGYLDCFKGIDRRRTEIVCLVWAIQNLSGNAFSGYTTYFLQQAGVSTASSYTFTLCQYAINTLGPVGAWLLMSRGIGRRSLYLYGLIGLCAMLTTAGFLGLASKNHKSTIGAATGGLMMGWAVIYQLTVGSVAYSLVGEIPSRRLLIKTVVLGRNLYVVVGIVTSVISPYCINPTAWNLGNYSALIWAGTCGLSIIYTYFRIPEPRGRSFAELDLLFEHKVSARKFSSTKVDVFGLPDAAVGSQEKLELDHVEK